MLFFRENKALALRIQGFKRHGFFKREIVLKGDYRHLSVDGTPFCRARMLSCDACRATRQLAGGIAMEENMKGKVVVISGATSGIGQVAAEKLAGMGARIVQVARDRERAQAALSRLNQITPGIVHTIYYATFRGSAR